MNNERIIPYKYLLSIAGLILLGLLLLLLAQSLDNGFWKTSLTQGASALFITGVISVLNRLYLSNDLVEIILSKINLKSDIDRTGIEMVSLTFNEINYRSMIKKSRENIDILHVYGRTWTSNNLEEIEERLLKTNCKIRVILLSPESEFISGLAEYYGITSDELKQRLEEVTSMWKDLFSRINKKNRKKSSNLKLYYHRGQPANSLYRIDDRIIFVQNKSTKGKTQQLPAIVCIDVKGKDLYGVYLSEINEMVKQAQEITLG